MYRIRISTSVAALALALVLSSAAAQDKAQDHQYELAQTPAGAPTFSPPSEDAIPKGQYGDMVRRGRDLFVNTQQLRGKYVGNGLNCVNCHLAAGRKAGAAPMWAAFGMYPKYRGKNDKVNTMEERIQGCFRYSMNGTPPPAGSEELTALVTYDHWLATGAPVGVKLAGRGYPKLAKPAQTPDIERGRRVFAANCAVCHGAHGQGQKAGGKSVFPPLWGKDSYNWGAGMHRINTAASFIKANMPLGKPNSLSDQEAWDVAAFVNSHERPQDPRFAGKLAQTDKTYHKHQCFYGDQVHGEVLGSHAPSRPSAGK